MRFCLLVLTVLSAVIMMTGCAVMDLSTLETAMPIAPARVQASGYVATGLDLASAADTYQSHHNLPNDSNDEDGDFFSSLSGFKVGISVMPKIDLIARYYISGDGLDENDLFPSYNYHHEDKTTGLKLGCKALIYKKDKNYVAFMPLYTRVRGENKEYWSTAEGGIIQDNNYTNLYNSDGLEAQMLYTYKAGQIVQFTLAGKYNYHHYSEIYRNVHSKVFHLSHYGITGNICVTFKPVFLMFELGQEMVPIHNGSTKNQSTVGMSLGFKI
ncbi:MAG: hypothetical protein PHH43_08165 [Candidatus Cloacimonetes bacterium]|nr:hypothetical protein [Candidatus Cloacimonadota bacterium]MDD3236281.1 hypothetical protein [Candidatus Cloacimonadota bacterium]